MAATLMEIKSAMLLPKDDIEAVSDDESLDPRHELIKQLLEYKKFKDAANVLRASADEQMQKYPRSDYILSQIKPDAEPELDMEQVNIWDLLSAFDTIMKATGNLMDVSHITDDTPIDLYQIEVLHRLQTEGPMSFERVFAGKKNRLVVVGLFLGVLELVREKLVTASQAGPDMPIYLRSLTDVPASKAVPEAIFATEQDQMQEESQASVPAVHIEQIDSADDNRQAQAEESSFDGSEQNIQSE